MFQVWYLRSDIDSILGTDSEMLNPVVDKLSEELFRYDIISKINDQNLIDIICISDPSELVKNKLISRASSDEIKYKVLLFSIMTGSLSDELRWAIFDSFDDWIYFYYFFKLVTGGTWLPILEISPDIEYYENRFSGLENQKKLFRLMKIIFLIEMQNDGAEFEITYFAQFLHDENLKRKLKQMISVQFDKEEKKLKDELDKYDQLPLEYPHQQATNIEVTNEEILNHYYNQKKTFKYFTNHQLKFGDCVQQIEEHPSFTKYLSSERIQFINSKIHNYYELYDFVSDVAKFSDHDGIKEFFEKDLLAHKEYQFLDLSTHIILSMRKEPEIFKYCIHFYMQFRNYLIQPRSPSWHGMDVNIIEENENCIIDLERDSDFLFQILGTGDNIELKGRIITMTMDLDLINSISYAEFNEFYRSDRIILAKIINNYQILEDYIKNGDDLITKVECLVRLPHSTDVDNVLNKVIQYVTTDRDLANINTYSINKMIDEDKNKLNTNGLFSLLNCSHILKLIFFSNDEYLIKEKIGTLDKMSICGNIFKMINLILLDDQKSLSDKFIIGIDDYYEIPFESYFSMHYVDKEEVILEALKQELSDTATSILVTKLKTYADVLENEDYSENTKIWIIRLLPLDNTMPVVFNNNRKLKAEYIHKILFENQDLPQDQVDDLVMDIVDLDYLDMYWYSNSGFVLRLSKERLLDLILNHLDIDEYLNESDQREIIKYSLDKLDDSGYFSVAKALYNHTDLLLDQIDKRLELLNTEKIISMTLAINFMKLIEENKDRQYAFRNKNYSTNQYYYCSALSHLVFVPFYNGIRTKELQVICNNYSIITEDNDITIISDPKFMSEYKPKFNQLIIDYVMNNVNLTELD